MEYRKLGNTGPNVSVVALGCEGFTNETREEVKALIDQALRSGVNFLDMFTPDPVIRSNVGAALENRRGEMIIQGHLGVAWVDGQYLRTRDPELTKKAFEDLLERLGTSYVDVGMIHYVDSVREWDELCASPFMDYILKQKESGRIRCVGLSSHNPDAAIKAVESGLVEVLLFAINPCYDMQPPCEDVDKLWADEAYSRELHNQDEQRKRLYELCEARGVGIDVMKAFGGGDLLSDELSPFGKAFTPAQCISYALTRPAVAAVMCGCKNEKELDDALDYLGADEAARDYTQVLSSLTRFTFSGHCLYCGHCAPCPVGIDVASVTKYLNLCLAQGTVPESERGHYALLEHHASECIACGGCESRCPFAVPAMENMKKAAELFGE